MGEMTEQEAREFLSDLDAREARGERLVTEEEYLQSKLHEMLDPTPARSEAAGGEERIAERDREAIQRAQAYDDSVGFLQRRCTDLLRRAEEAESELASLRHQLAAADAKAKDRDYWIAQCCERGDRLAALEPDAFRWRTFAMAAFLVTDEDGGLGLVRHIEEDVEDATYLTDEEHAQLRGEGTGSGAVVARDAIERTIDAVTRANEIVARAESALPTFTGGDEQC